MRPGNRSAPQVRPYRVVEHVAVENEWTAASTDTGGDDLAWLLRRPWARLGSRRCYRGSRRSSRRPRCPSRCLVAYFQARGLATVLGDTHETTIRRRVDVLVVERHGMDVDVVEDRGPFGDHCQNRPSRCSGSGGTSQTLLDLRHLAASAPLPTTEERGPPSTGPYAPGSEVSPKKSPHEIASTPEMQT